jgi:EAL domain-containing protein (putative c-di-GMP-specific phosphodiesterase class I)
VVAEGVERSDQLSFLVAEGCPIVQGYHFCRAVPAAEIPAYVRSFSMLSTA